MVARYVGLVGAPVATYGGHGGYAITVRPNVRSILYTSPRLPECLWGREFISRYSGILSAPVICRFE